MKPIRHSAPSLLIFLLSTLLSSAVALPNQGPPPTCSAVGQLVLFSRRVYKTQGPSYQQIWSWKPSDGSLTRSPRNHARPIWKGSQITFISPDAWEAGSKLWNLNPATGEERPLGPAPADTPEPQHPKNGCEVRANSGELAACARQEDLSITRAGKQLASFHIANTGCATVQPGVLGPCDTPIEGLTWSPDGKWLLVEELGLNTGSTSPQSDDYVVDVRTMRLSKAASTSAILWLPGSDALLYTTPRDSAKLPGTQCEAHCLGAAVHALQPGHQRSQRDHLRAFKQPRTLSVLSLSRAAEICSDPARCPFVSFASNLWAAVILSTSCLA